MTKRKHSPTSEAAHEFVKEYIPPTWEKIVEALKKIKVGGTYEKIAEVAGLKESQVWKRLSELRDKRKLIYECGYTHKTASGCDATVWQLIGLGYKNEDKTPVNRSERKRKPKAKQLEFF